MQRICHRTTGKVIEAENIAPGCLNDVSSEDLQTAEDGYLRYKNKYEDTALAREIDQENGVWEILAPEIGLMTPQGRKSAILTERKKDGSVLTRLNPDDTSKLGISIDHAGDLIVQRYLGSIQDIGIGADDLQKDIDDKEADKTKGYLAYRRNIKDKLTGEVHKKNSRLRRPTDNNELGDEVQYGYFLTTNDGRYVRSYDTNDPLEVQHAIQAILQHDNKNGLWGRIAPQIASRVMYDLVTDRRWMMFQEFITYTNPWTAFGRGYMWAQSMLGYIALMNFFMYGEASAYGKMDLLVKMYFLNLILRRGIPAGFRCHDFREAQFGPTAAIDGTEDEPIRKTEETMLGEAVMVSRQLARGTGWIAGDTMALDESYYLFHAFVLFLKGQPGAALKTIWDGFRKFTVWQQSGYSLEGQNHIRLLLRGFISEPNFLIWVFGLGLLATLMPGLLTAKNPIISGYLFLAVMTILIGQKVWIPAIKKIFKPNKPGETLSNLIALGAMIGLLAVLYNLLGTYLMPYSLFHVFLILLYVFHQRILKSVLPSYKTLNPDLRPSSFKRLLKLGLWVGVLAVAAVFINFVLLPYVIAPPFYHAVDVISSIMAASYQYTLWTSPVIVISSSYGGAVVPTMIPANIISGVSYLSYYLFTVLFLRGLFATHRAVSRFAAFRGDMLYEHDVKGHLAQWRNWKQVSWWAGLLGKVLLGLVFVWPLKGFRRSIVLSYQVGEDANRAGHESIRHTSTLLRMLLIRTKFIIAAFENYLTGAAGWFDLRVLNKLEAKGLPLSQYYDPKLELLLPLQLGAVVFVGVLFGLFDPALFWKGFPIFFLSWVLGGIFSWYTSNFGGSHHYEPLGYSFQCHNDFRGKLLNYEITHGVASVPVDMALRFLNEVTQGNFSDNANINQDGKEVPDRDRVRMFFRYLTDLDLSNPAFLKILERHIDQRVALDRNEGEDLPIVATMGHAHWESKWDKLADLVRIEILNDLWLDPRTRPQLFAALKMQPVDDMTKE
ncbi:MAG: hypothetical protein NC930_09360, partial [Candidatus Omnitrophica bacterium]|nr:hypothetical protein [Candidatus Omnitrophota bacterium]